MNNITVVINARNEEKNIRRAIQSAKFADEIVVCDMESEDGTVKIAKSLGAKVYSHKKTGYVEPARNFVISKATSDWIFILDADEEIPPTLAYKLRSLVNKGYSYYRTPRKNVIFGRFIKHSRWWPDYNIRFFKKGSVVWSEIIHSVPETEGQGFDLEAKVENAITHYNYQSIEQYLERLNNYTTHQAKLLIDQGYKFEWTDILLKPSSEFFSRYFLGQGYKDGIHGLGLAMLQSFSELILYLKVWQHEKFPQQDIKIGKLTSTLDLVDKDLHYWKADLLEKNGGGVIQKIKRRFKLA